MKRPSIVMFGKYKGTNVLRLLIADPGYVLWAVRCPNPSPNLASLAESLKCGIETFDKMPFVNTCQLCRKSTARYATAYRSRSGFSTDLHWWCRSCDPYDYGVASRGTLIHVDSYIGAISLTQRCDGTKWQLFDMARNLAAGKGLTGRATTKAIASLFEDFLPEEFSESDEGGRS